jgi:hypothetical protein
VIVYILEVRTAYSHPEIIGIFPDKDSANVIREFHQRRDSAEYTVTPWEVDKSGGTKNPIIHETW